MYFSFRGERKVHRVYRADKPKFDGYLKIPPKSPASGWRGLVTVGLWAYYPLVLPLRMRSRRLVMELSAFFA